MMPVSGALAGGLAFALGMSLGANAVLAFRLVEESSTPAEERVADARDVREIDPLDGDDRTATA